MTVTQARRAPGRMPSERAVAARREYSVRSLASWCGTATITMGTSATCADGSGLGWYCMPAALIQRRRCVRQEVPRVARPRSPTVTCCGCVRSNARWAAEG